MDTPLYTFNIINITKISDDMESDNINILASGTTIPFSVDASQNMYKFAKFSQINDPNFAVKTRGGDTYIEYIGKSFTYCTAMISPVNWNASAKYQIWINAENIFEE
jgi:hypothetical protein